MPTYEVGSTIRIQYRNLDVSGALANAGTLTGQFTLPDGTTTAATITNPSVGVYVASVVSAQAGRYRLRLTGSGANSERLPYTDVADVWATDPRLVISLDDARANINIPALETSSDDELRLFIASATDILVDLATMLDLSVLPVAVTEDHSPRSDVLGLDYIPASITSVTEYVGTTATVVAPAANPGTSGETYTVEGSILVRRSSGWRTPWNGDVRVVYTWGSSVISPRVILAARELVSHLWTIGQRGNRPSFGGEDYTMTPSGYAVPNRVVEILDPTGQGRVSGIA